MIEFRDLTINGTQDFNLYVPELKISSSQFIQIYGSSSSGKTLLLKTIAGQYRNYTGEIFYNGLKIEQGKYKVFMINTTPAVLTERTVRENLLLPFHKLSKRKEEILNSLLENTGLNRFRNTPVKAISNSEKKSLELIRAVIQLPNFLLIDDYDCSFDNLSLIRLSSVFEYAAKAGITIAVSSKVKLENIVLCYYIQDGVLHKL